MWQLVLDDGVEDCGVVPLLDGKEEGAMGPTTVAFVYPCIGDHGVEQCEAASVTDGVIDGVVDVAGRGNDNGLVSGILTGTVREGGDKPYMMGSRREIVQGVAFGGCLAVAKVPFQSLAGLAGEPRVLGIGRDDAVVGELIAYQAIGGVDQLGGELGIRIAVTSYSFHHQTAVGAGRAHHVHRTAIDAAVAHRQTLGRREGDAGIVLVVPSIGESGGGREHIGHGVAAVGGGDDLVGAVEGEIGVAEMSRMVAVVGG